MPKNRISDLLGVSRRFLRSTNIERDFTDPTALEGYILTSENLQHFDRLTTGLREGSTQRAWRLTGDFGRGKSSFGLLLALTIGDRASSVPLDIERLLESPNISATVPLHPVLITGSRGSISEAILKALRDQVGPCVSGVYQDLIHHNVSDPHQNIDDIALEALSRASELVRANGMAKGLLLIIDELGKFLEYAAEHVERQDIYFLQRLAEQATRSGQIPLFVVGILHQGFSSYSNQLSVPAQREWQKVAGRFEELLFNQPIEQIAEVVASAINIDTSLLPAEVKETARSEMVKAIDLGWYGSSTSPKRLVDLAPALYPLHPSVIPAMERLFSRYGQHERSIFSFLMSNEPHGFMEFCRRPLSSAQFLRLDTLYDYTRANLGYSLSVQSYRSHWNHIDAVIRTFNTSDLLELSVLKTVGLLNLIDSANMVAADKSIALAVGDERVGIAVEALRSTQHVIYYRGASGGYCLWPHTSVNLEMAYREAEKAIGSGTSVGSYVRSYLDAQPIVARRHYIETGTLRTFEVRYIDPSEVNIQLSTPTVHDGLVLIPLCETNENRSFCINAALESKRANDKAILIGIPPALDSLFGLIQEARRWQWILANTPELNHDNFAAEEVARQIAAAHRAVEARVKVFLGLAECTASSEILWFYAGKEVNIPNGRVLLGKLSSICNDVYPLAPRIANELIMRRTLSSAAAAARMRLIDRILRFSTDPLLGMDPDKRPPEMSMYMSVLEQTGLHVNGNEAGQLLLPAIENDRNTVLPAFNAVLDALRKCSEARVPVSILFDMLRTAPFGVRDGLIPVLLAVLVAIYSEHIALYENGNFIQRATGADFMRLVKAPNTFELQYCHIGGIRMAYLERLAAVLDISTDSTELNLLAVVRSLCNIAAGLPTFTRRTKNLTPTALAIRDILLHAGDPAPLVFTQLPEACGFPAIGTEGQPSVINVDGLISSFQVGITELQRAYDALVSRSAAEIHRAFGFDRLSDQSRSNIAKRASILLPNIHEIDLKAFAARLADRSAAPKEWTESISAYLAGKPPTKWADTDEDLFNARLKLFASQFRRVEAVNFGAGIPPGCRAMRIAITNGDGSEREDVLYLTPQEEQEAAEIRRQVLAILEPSRRIASIAATQAIWELLTRGD